MYPIHNTEQKEKGKCQNTRHLLGAFFQIKLDCVALLIYIQELSHQLAVIYLLLAIQIVFQENLTLNSKFQYIHSVPIENFCQYINHFKTDINGCQQNLNWHLEVQRRQVFAIDSLIFGQKSLRNLSIKIDCLSSLLHFFSKQCKKCAIWKKWQYIIEIVPQMKYVFKLQNIYFSQKVVALYRIESV